MTSLHSWKEVQWKNDTERRTTIPETQNNEAIAKHLQEDEDRQNETLKQLQSEEDRKSAEQIRAKESEMLKRWQQWENSEPHKRTEWTPKREALHYEPYAPQHQKAFSVKKISTKQRTAGRN